MNAPYQQSAIAHAVRYALRPYQAQAKAEIYDAWGVGHRNVLAVLPTGAGKTVTFSDVIREHNGAACAIAHRQELVTQISLALARDGIRHKIIGPKKVVKLANAIHMEELGLSYVDQQARVAVAGVDTLIRAKDLEHWRQSVTLWVMDEAHHVLAENKWGQAAQMFPNAKGLGVTATPGRADKKGLGRHADGLFDYLIEGPTMRDLIDMGYLTDYRLFAPPSDLTMAGNKAGGSGDWSPQQLKTAAKKSHIIGDVVTHYLRIAPGKLGVTFATDVETATDIARQFNEAGVPAAVVSAKTPDRERVSILRQFKRRELLQLVNVDLFGEGFDLPAIEVVSMARPTESYGLYVQQFGRALRLMIDAELMRAWDGLPVAQRLAHIAASGKPKAIIIDHVGNIERHGLPDAPRTWSLDRGDRRARGPATDAIPVRACPECTSVYERVFVACPYCNHTPVPAIRSGPEFVDGDLTELDLEALKALRGEVDRVAGPVRYPQGLSGPARARLFKDHSARHAAQLELRDAVAWWAGHQRVAGRSDRESYRLFFHTFGTDVMTAQTLPAADAAALTVKINERIGR